MRGGVKKRVGADQIEVGESFAPEVWWGNKGDWKICRGFVHFLVSVFAMKKTRNHG